jgi:sec-independent protein translocase protein TatA
MFRNPTTDLIVILVIVLLIFGPKRLPGLGKQLGSGLREFKESITGESGDEDEAVVEPPRAQLHEATPAPVADPAVPAVSSERDSTGAVAPERRP